MSNEEIMEQEFEQLRVDMIREYNAKGMKASGQFERELKVEVSEFRASLIGMNYAEQLELGRERTVNGNTGGQTLLEKIKTWIEDKGIRPLEPKMTTSTLAFLITRKIHREGWDRRNHGGVELVSSVITPERIQKIIDRVSQFNVAKFTSEIGELYKELQIA